MDGKRIQFGHTQGVLILTLGCMLIATQALISFYLLPSSVQDASPENAIPVAIRSMFFIPGIVGILTTAVGFYFIVQDKFKIRNTSPPAKTQIGLPDLMEEKNREVVRAPLGFGCLEVYFLQESGTMEVSVAPMCPCS